MDSVARNLRSARDTTSATDSASASAPSPGTLFSLPQELQDEIFKLAFQGEGTRLMSRRDWDARESRRKREDRKHYIKQPFPDPKVCEFTVSKRFFVAASRAWVGNQHFHDLNHFAHEGDLGIIFAFLRQGTLSEYVPDWISTIPNLRALRYVACPWRINKISEDISVVEDTMGDAECRLWAQGTTIGSLRGLTNFEMLPESDVYLSEAEQAVYLDNVARLSNCLRTLVTQPKPEDSDGLDRSFVAFYADRNFDPLYFGSAVSASTSMLLLGPRCPTIYTNSDDRTTVETLGGGMQMGHRITEAARQQENSSTEKTGQKPTDNIIKLLILALLVMSSLVAVLAILLHAAYTGQLCRR